VPRIDQPFCQKCGIPAKETEPREASAFGAIALCAKCRSNPPAYQMMRSWAVFDSPIQNGLHTMKYRGNIAFGESLATNMVDFVCSLHWPIEVLIPVPLGKKRLEERGYNQVGLVARPLAYQLGWIYEPNALWKTRETRSQVGLTAVQRSANVQDAYQADTKIVRQQNILLMDDVATTGSTISACTQALLCAGAKEVYVLTIARALSHHSLDRV
jgi:ComF family protein